MNILYVDTVLAEVFGRYSSQGWQPSDPMDELIETVLNHRTTNAHARRAMENLRGCAGGWGQVFALPHDTLVDLVRPAGLARLKAARIHGILERVFGDSGEFSLEFLRSQDSRTATRYLCGLPGVGAHTAALVQVFAFGRRGVMPVDGHVHRVARRLGWAEPTATAAAVQRSIEAAGVGVLLMDLHVNLIRLGHRHCGPGTPDCPNCPVSEECRTAHLQPWW